MIKKYPTRISEFRVGYSYILLPVDESVCFNSPVQIRAFRQCLHTEFDRLTGRMS